MGQLKYPMYLGGSVHAAYDGFHVVLMAGSDDSPDNEIYLDESNIAAFVGYLEALRTELNNEKFRRENIDKRNL